MHLVKAGNEKQMFGKTHHAEDELVKHPGYEESPVDVQQLKNHQHHVEEVVSKEGRIVVQRVHPGTVDQPVRDMHLVKRQARPVSQIGHFLHLPERENDHPGNHKEDSKNHKDGISSPMPFGVVQHLCTLKNRNRRDSATVAVMFERYLPQR